MMLVAVDAGGTSTRAAVVDGEGKLRGLGVAGSGNPTAVGREAADGAVIAAVSDALAAAGVLGGSVTGGALCSAGRQDEDRVSAIRAGTGIRPEAPVAQVGDAVGAYLAVADEPTGIALVVGTGSVAIRVEGTRIAEVFDGAGWLLGDLGSGFWLGQAVAQAVAADIDGRGPHTSLTPALLEQVGVGDVSGWGVGRAPEFLELLRHSYEAPPVGLAGFAPLAFAHARADSVAGRIVAAGASHVAATLRAAHASAPGAPIAGSGSVLVRGYLAPDALPNDLSTALAGIDFRRCDDGLVGAAMLALEHAGVPRTRSIRDELAAAIRDARE